MTTALAKLADITGASSEEISNVIKGMIISSKNQHGAIVTDAEMAVVTGTCARYGLNPLTKEAHAFISGGKLQMIVGVDGWAKIMNRQENFDGIEFDDQLDDNGKITAITAKIYIKGRSRPVCTTEYMNECFDPKSSVWKRWPNRMLRHKAMIQCCRMAFGISEVIDDDEKSRIVGNSPAPEKNVTPQVDFKAIEAILEECADIDTLKAECGEIRTQLQKQGQWDSSKAVIIGMHQRHKDRIDAAYGEDVKVEPSEVDDEIIEGTLVEDEGFEE
mgnify:CR=1 FL=1